MTGSSTVAGHEEGACVGGGAFVGGELLDEATLDARESELTTLSAHMDAATHRQLTLVRLMDLSERWAKQGAKSCAAWLSWKIGLAPGPAREHVRVANALAVLPQIDDALRRGAISYSKVRAMTRVATPANEQKLLDAALETTAAQLEKVCRGMRQVQREDGRPPEDDSPERFVRLRHRGDGTVGVQAVLHPDEAQRVMEALRVVRAAMSEAQNPPSELRGVQPDLADALTRIADDILAGARPAHGAAPSRGNADRLDHSPGRNPHAPSQGNAENRLDTATATVAPSRENADGHLRDPPDIDADIDAAGANENAGENPAGDHTVDPSAPGVSTGEPADHTSPSANRSAADRSASGGTARTSGADRTQVIVHLTEDRIDGGHAAVLDDGTRITPETFRRLACDCALVGVREDHRGDPLDIGRKTRAIPPALRRAVLLRDEHCQFPGCTHDRHIDLHHIEHWAHGGPTSKQNLIALCTFHHTLVHEGGFTLEPSDDGPRFRAPDRTRLPTFHVPPPAPADPLQAFERAHQDLHIHDQTGLTRWDGERVHYGDVVEVLCAADQSCAADEPCPEEPCADELSAPDPCDLDLPVRAWLAKHGVDD